MLKINYGERNSINIIGIDPGTTNIGISNLNIDIDTKKINYSLAFTINAAKFTNENSWLAQLHGNRFNRINFIENKLIEIFHFYMPLIICAESPFFGRSHPNAFQALTEVICTIRSAVIKYDQWRDLKLVPPSLVKQAIGSKGNADKIVMKQNLLAINHILNIQDIQNLDEHGIDALAVGYYIYNQLIY